MLFKKHLSLLRNLQSSERILSISKGNLQNHYFSYADNKKFPSFFLQNIFFSSSVKPLPVLEALLNKRNNKKNTLPLAKTAIFYVHHSLQTSVNLLEAIISLGAKEKNIFVLGKHYSDCPEVVKQVISLGVNYQQPSSQIGLGKFDVSFTRDINWLWSKLINTIDDNVEEILILDHGGHAITYVPSTLYEKYKVIAIEKTTGGLIKLEEHGLPPFPIINVANCAAKKILESPLIADAAIEKLLPSLPINDPKITCGVIGYGAIGKALTTKLLSMGHKVIIFDNNPQQMREAKDAIVVNDLSVLVAASDYIFGCSGRDISKSIIDHFRFCKDKTLISCSSEDREFLSLLQFIPQKRQGKIPINPLDDIFYTNNIGATIRIMRGGFPVNFDHSGESVPANDIQLTRALVLAGILQAVQFFRNKISLDTHGLYALDTKAQFFIVNEWLKTQPHSRFSKNTIDIFKNYQLISKLSEGIQENYDGFKDNTYQPKLTC